MLNQGAYGRMDNPQTPQPGVPYSVPCQKCKAVFLLEKPHIEVQTQDMFWGHQKDGTLAPATPKNIKMFRLCPSCFKNFQDWLQ